MGRGPDRQYARRGLDFDLIPKSRNLQQWLRETDAPGISNFDQLPPNFGDPRQA